MELSSLLNSDLASARNLRELKLMKINFELDYRDWRGNGNAPKDVTSVRVLRIDYSGQNCDGFSPKGWCEKLAAIFPNLEQLVARQPYDDGDFRQELDDNRGLFKQLKVLKFIEEESGDMWSDHLQLQIQKSTNISTIHSIIWHFRNVIFILNCSF